MTPPPSEFTHEIDRYKVISLIQQDWIVKPFVRLDTFDGNCPEGWELVFERVWDGLDEGCLYNYYEIVKERKTANGGYIGTRTVGPSVK